MNENKVKIDSIDHQDRAKSIILIALRKYKLKNIKLKLNKEGKHPEDVQDFINTYSDLHKNYPAMKKVLENVYNAATMDYDNAVSYGMVVLNRDSELFPKGLRIKLMDNEQKSWLDNAEYEKERSEYYLIPEELDILYCMGNVGLLNKDCMKIAIVGSRAKKKNPAHNIPKKPSDHAVSAAEQLSKKIIEDGGITVSGLATGIDLSGQKMVEHQTIAVLPHGLGVMPKNKEAAASFNNISSSGGLLVSEYDPYDDASIQNLMDRNRIVAGLAQAVMPVEFEQRGGTIDCVGKAILQDKIILLHKDIECSGKSRILSQQGDYDKLFLINSFEEIKTALKSGVNTAEEFVKIGEVKKEKKGNERD